MDAGILQSDGKLTCSIVILTYNDFETTSHLLEMIRNYGCFEHIVVVDNCSTDGSYERLRAYADGKVILLRALGNDGYSKGNNVGIRYIQDSFDTDIICIANPDIEFEEELAEHVLEVFEKKEDYCLLAGLQVTPDGDLAGHPFWMEYTDRQWFSMILSNFRIIGKLMGESITLKYIRHKLASGKKLIRVGAVEGSMFFVRSREFKEMGLFDEGVWIYCEEDILAKKMKRMDRKAGVLTSCRYVHYGAKTTGKVFASRTKADHTFHSSVYFFNHYQSDNKFLQALNWLMCEIVHIESLFASYVRKVRGGG